MLSKIPIISTNVGGTKEFLNKKNSNIVKPHSPENIKELLKDYLKNKKQWLEKANMHQNISRKHSEIMGQNLKKFLSNNYMNVRKKIIIFDFDGVLVNTLNVMEIA